MGHPKFIKTKKIIIIINNNNSYNNNDNEGEIIYPYSKV